jgi:hypothetical protein
MELKEAKDLASKLVVDKLRDWYDIVLFGEPLIESSDSDKQGDIQVYILQGYIEVEFKGDGALLLVNTHAQERFYLRSS